MLGRLLQKMKKGLAPTTEAPLPATGPSPLTKSRDEKEPAAGLAAAGPIKKSSPPPFTPIKALRWQLQDTLLEHYRIETATPAPEGDGAMIYGCRHLLRPFQARLETPPTRLLTSPVGLRQIIVRAEQRIKLGMHPNLAAAFNLRFIERLPILIGEEVEGESLAQWLAAKRCGNNPRIDLSLAIQFCHGLEHCHALGLIHGRISPATIMITPRSLVKVCGLGLADYPETGGGGRVSIAEDIKAFGHCLWQIFCSAPPYSDPSDPKRPGKPQAAKPGFTFPVPLQVALLKCLADDPARCYPDFAALRRDLNLAYRELFKISCPYFNAPRIDYRAEILNNQAVMLLEEGKSREAEGKLARSLEINDKLPEAVCNDLLFRWRGGQATPARILRRIEAHRQPQREQPCLLELEKAVKLKISGLKDDFDGEKAPGAQPQMIAPPQRLTVYRQPLERLKLQRTISDHLKQRRYQACHDLLLQSWGGEGFVKDKFFNQIYEELLLVREKERPVQAQRFLKLSGHQSPVIAMACIPRSRRIASLGADGRLIIHDLGSGGKPEIVENQELQATCMAACPSGKHLAVGCGDGGVHLLSTRSGQKMGQEQSHRRAVTALVFNHDGKLLASGGADGSITVRRLSTGREDAVSLGDSGAIQALLYPNEELDMVSGSEDGVIREWKSRLRECTTTIPAHPGAINALAAAAKGRSFPELLISAGGESQIKIWQRADGKCRQTLKGHGERIRALLTLADGKTLISAGEDDLIQLWDLQKGERRFALDGRGDGIFSLARGPRSHTFLAGRSDGVINIWLLIYQLNFELI